MRFPIPFLLALASAPFAQWGSYPLVPAHELRFPASGYQWAMTRTVGESHFSFLAVGENGVAAFKGWRNEGGVWGEVWGSASGSALGMPRGARGIASSGSRYIAVGEGTVDAAGMQVPAFATSVDGSVWTRLAATLPGTPWSLAYGAGAWVMTGTRDLGASAGQDHAERFEGQIQVSVDDGATWRAVALEGGVTLFRAFWNGSLWVAVGERRESGVGSAIVESRIYTSQDGEVWMRADCAGGATLRSVTFGHGLWVAVGESDPSRGTPNALVLVSRDGLSWTDVSPNSVDAAAPLHDVDTTRFGFVAVGAHRILHSYDGTTWIPVYPSVPHVFKAVRTEAFGSEGSVAFLLADTGRAFVDTLEEVPPTTAVRGRDRAVPGGWAFSAGRLRVPAHVTGSVRVEIVSAQGRAESLVAGRRDADGTLTLPSRAGIRFVRVRTETGETWTGTAMGL